MPDPARCCTTDTRGCPRVCHEPQWHTRHRDWCTQNMEPVHTAQPRTAGHATPVHTWHWARRASTRNLAHNTCTQPGQVQPGTQHLYTVWPATAWATTVAPWHMKARQLPNTQRSPLCHHPCQTVLAPASTAQHSSQGTVETCPSVESCRVSLRSPQGAGPASAATYTATVTSILDLEGPSTAPTQLGNKGTRRSTDPNQSSQRPHAAPQPLGPGALHGCWRPGSMAMACQGSQGCPHTGP